MPNTHTATISSLPFGAVIRLPDDRVALFYYDKYESGLGDAYVKKAQFWVDQEFVILGCDEEVEVIALPLDAATAVLPLLLQADPTLRTIHPGPPPKRRREQDPWFRTEDLNVGALVYLPTGGIAIYRGRLPEGAGGKYTCTPEQGGDVTLRADRLIRVHAEPVNIARWYIKHVVMGDILEPPLAGQSRSDAPAASEDQPHPLQSLLPIAVNQRIMELESLSDDQFPQRWAEWRDEAVADPRFASEVVLYRSKKPGESAAAFAQLAQVIAVLSFVPGGVTVFNHTWCGRRPTPSDTAHDQAIEGVPTE